MQLVPDMVRPFRPERRGLPPGLRLPPAAQTAWWLRSPISLLHDARDRFGDVFSWQLVATPPFVSFSDPEAVREIFTGPADQLYAGEANELLEPILGPSSLLLLDGEPHLRQRRLLLPPFHGARMRSYGEVMRRSTEAAIARMPRGRPTPLHEVTRTITLDVILRAVFGLDEGPALARLHVELGALLEQVADPLLLIPAFQRDLGSRSPGGRLTRRLEAVDRLLYALIDERRARGREDREDVLSMLVEARDEEGAPMRPEELRDELLTLLVAGHETTATSLCWTVYQLLANRPALERLEAELEAAGEVDPDRVRELPWLDAVIKEALRLRPVVPMVGRRLQRPMTFGGVDLPAGVVAVPNIYLTHRNPAVWPEPDRFDPARMLDRKPSPYELFPFGGGVRRCVGMAFALYESQVVLATLISRLRLRPVPGYRMRLVRRSITFAPSEGMPVIAEAR